MKLNLLEIANYLSLEVHGNDILFNDLIIDSRKVKKDDLFVAIPGQNYDGHDYIQESILKGASAIICNKAYDTKDITVPYIVCEDTISSLGVIAQKYKISHGSPYTIGITGTNGKTTVTKLTAQILKQSYSTSTTIGNFNNDIGLPLSIISSINNEIDKCVYELGASKRGDISRLVKICEPDMTTLLNVSEAHMESFGSMKNLIATKEEIFSHLKTNQVILNIDDINFQNWKKINDNKRVITISLNNNADYFIKSSDRSNYSFSTVKGDFSIRRDYVSDILPINLLFSISLSMEAGASIEDVKNGLKSFEGVNGRFRSYISSKKAIIIDDSYNANPESMKSSLNQLKQYNENKIFVMGDMGELGKKSREHHLSIFNTAKTQNIMYLFYMGKYKDEAKSIFGDSCFVYNDISQLIEDVRELMNENTVVLIKASRFMNFDLIAKGLK